ncbi:hypothetical protein JOL62DRAFT_34726 [Phyllosticta paracitricarpa]|uniref:Uncharacterized protein n=1 Tax=Phyllosticta paracitricarpa TaxID=2016321 RepID=A0ABR1NBA2_9PEZI
MYIRSAVPYVCLCLRSSRGVAGNLCAGRRGEKEREREGKKKKKKKKRAQGQWLRFCSSTSQQPRLPRTQTTRKRDGVVLDAWEATAGPTYSLLILRRAARLPTGEQSNNRPASGQESTALVVVEAQICLAGGRRTIRNGVPEDEGVRERAFRVAAAQSLDGLSSVVCMVLWFCSLSEARCRTRLQGTSETGLICPNHGGIILLFTCVGTRRRRGHGVLDE